MTLYAIDKLMSETRRVAAEYHQLTGQALPVSQELSRYDVERILGFVKPESVEAGVDLIGSGEWQDKKIQVKARVLFEDKRQKVGQLNPEAQWQAIALVLFDPEYVPQEIYIADREVLLPSLEKLDPEKAKKSSFSVAKFKALAELVWQQDNQ